MKNRLYRYISWIGIFCVVCSISLCAYNVYDSFRSYFVSKQKMNAYHVVKTSVGSIPDYVLNPDMEMPEVDVDGISCIGTLEIPRLDLNLCVTSTFSDENMKQLPCRYYGSIYKSNMVIIAHNYWFHFGRLNTLKSGDEVIFTDVSGNCFKYSVAAKDVVGPESVAEVTNGKWPLTLVTCTLDSQNRIVVRCKRQVKKGEFYNYDF